ncbi:hypothetical protein D9757_001608 [Collybiopsis confluens]|uniref:SPT2 chromatin protein n=1 Tax=Collybiopsis confluens TaxID=2823264 RepID=A0A8H5HZA7_9AGAR|nr:hypothetical protein D9757_001608 [Collybiopsis confluens]
MSSFAALMAISATQTEASKTQADAILADRKRREAEARKDRLEQEKKDRAREVMLRKRHFEEKQKEEERNRKKEEEKKALEAQVERRKAAERDHLLYGAPKKSNAGKPRIQKTVSHATVDDGEDMGSRSEPLTREELRERKLQTQLKRQFTAAKRSTTTGGYQRHGRRLPGGAVDVLTNGPSASSGPSSGSQSVKARLAAMPNTLTKLNTVKRDTRTIDEILQDRAKERELKILDGEEALAFDDWFGNKKKEKSRPGSVAPTSGENTPKSSVPGSRAPGTPPTSSLAKKSSAISKPAMPSKQISKSASRPSEKQLSSRQTPLGFRAAPASSSRGSSSMPVFKKRARSPGRSESPRPKRRAVPRSSEELDDDFDDDVVDMKGLIWGIMGKNRNDYVKMDVFSDDEDMEADASALEREEKQSARLAKREDLAAMEEERRREEEKRRRKMMRN